MVVKHPLWATCDVCAEGDVPCRADGDAYVCVMCDARHQSAIITAASVLGMDSADAETVIDAYLAERFRQDSAEAGDTEPQKCRHAIYHSGCDWCNAHDVEAEAGDTDG
jgi:hypothetical protein